MEIMDPPTVEPDPCYSFDSIPNEIIEYHIFRYFWFQYWTQNFVSVCKRWKQICENATITPKHLRISPKLYLDVGQAIQWVKKYQPTILELNFKIQSFVHNLTIDALVGASECIDTLILDVHKSSFFDQPKPKALSKIRTLFWKPKFSERIFEFFPSLQRLQIIWHDSDESYRFKCKFPVEELTLIDPYDVDFCLKQINVRKLTLTVIRSYRKVLQKIDGNIKELNIVNMTYEQYFRHFGDTKLYRRLSAVNYKIATRHLKNEVSYEYESDLVKGYYISYEYPTYKYHDFNYDIVFERDEYWSKEHNFQFSNKLPVSDRVRFIHMVHKGDVDAAVEILLNTGATMGSDLRVATAFFNLLLYTQFNAKAFANSNVRTIAITIIEADIKNGWKLLKTLQQFEKIADLIDWSKAFAHTKDYDLFWAMVDKGAQIPYQNLRDNVNFYWLPDAGTACSEIMKELFKRDPSIWYDILATGPKDALNIMKRANISLTIEKNGKALWHAWYKNGLLPTDDLFPTYINHIDSTGSTLLMEITESLDISNLEIVLKKGADPNKHQLGKLSPLADLLVTSRRKNVYWSNWMLLLFNAGADVNLACTFEGRQCSPLMIAVLVGSPLPTISLLIALGARTDYCDDQGRSVVDCVVECESKYEASDYRTLKWLLNKSI